MTTVADLAVAWLTCPTCSAVQGRPCVVRHSGRPTRPHSPRLDPLMLAFWLGYDEGRVAGHQQAASVCRSGVGTSRPPEGGPTRIIRSTFLADHLDREAARLMNRTHRD